MAGCVPACLATGGPVALPVLLVCAHPDDETIGAGTLLGRCSDAVVLHVTDGAPRDGRDTARHGFADVAAYAAARRQEALAALGLAGLGPERIRSLGVPDQQAALRLAALARRIAALIEERPPAILVTHAYEGGHPDHDAVACAVHAALRLAPPPRPVLLEMTGYHAGPSGIETGRFLPIEGHPPPVVLPFGAEARALKRRMLDAFATQREVLAHMPFAPDTLRIAPACDFTRPPHPERLFYEGFDWGMTGPRFCALAGAAHAELGLEAT